MAFAELIKGEPTDKEYQRKIIDNLVFMVYVYDNEIVTYLNFGVDKAIERVRLDETNAAIEGLKKVQTLSPLLHQTAPQRGCRFAWAEVFAEPPFRWVVRASRSEKTKQSETFAALRPPEPVRSPPPTRRHPKGGAVLRGQR